MFTSRVQGKCSIIQDVNPGTALHSLEIRGIPYSHGFTTNSRQPQSTIPTPKSR
ncbi:hypothetical protein e56106_A0A2N0NXA4_9GLOM [Rhizophagus irregularis DAOM 181602=DAOM 197198]|uniref:Uncharacterized protein n=1 Tax=Rhizophagus irregularis (strain DAOM 181602 / DAOM 197198 / MUCL 43194) TaxID=747089 RepID=U9U707_RHIID|nr:hypothetical protein e56106_A0A2N0NXA4_9GLOM [Rhizophagus irregularis DAOM 181602=DAOM 197198]